MQKTQPRSVQRPIHRRPALALPATFIVWAFCLTVMTGATRAAEAPNVFFSESPTALVPFPTLAPANGTDPLWLALAPGPAQSALATESLCEDGAGDEICGFTVVLETEGDLFFSSFCQTSCAAGLVHHIDPSGRFLRINQVGLEAAGSAGPILIGDVQFSTQDPSGTAPGFVFVHDTSEAVGAALQILSPRPETDPAPATFCVEAQTAGGFNPDAPLACSLPEPALGLSTALGALLLSAAGRRQGRRTRRELGAGRAPRRRKRRLVMLAGTGAALAVAGAAVPQQSAAQLFTDEAAFLTALGETPSRVGFENVPLSSAGFLAARDGDRIGHITLFATGVASNLNLAFVPGVPLGLFGSMLVADPNATGNPALYPGGTAFSNDDPEQDDDLLIVFDGPVQAAGLRILGNDVEAGEALFFLDVQGDPLLTAPLPAGDSFVGYIRQPGDPSIGGIEIEESGLAFDDIGVDEILSLPGANPYADAVVSFNPDIVADEPSLSNRDPQNSLDAPDLATVSLGEGGTLVLRFVDNALTGSGNPLPDLRIVEGQSTDERVAVEISANGVTWYDLGWVDGGTADLNLDAFGFDENDAFFFVRLTDDAADVGPTGATRGADIDAVEALSFRYLPPDADDDHVPDAVDVCPNTYDERQGDEDFDGIGDVCDNCRWVANPTQADANADGVGDACEPARVELARDFTPFDLGPLGQRLARLRLDCGGLDLHSVTVGLWIPPGLTGVSVSQCEAPIAGEGPPGAPSGIGCPTFFLGPTVDPARSGAFGVPLGIPTQLPPASFRSDVVYVSFKGNVGPDDLLCSAGQTDVPLARITAATTAGLDGVVSYSIEDGVASDWCLLGKGDGSCADTSLGTLAMLTSGVPMVAEVLVRPPAGLPTNITDEWEICLSEDTGALMHRVTMGLLGPDGATSTSLKLQGCDVTPAGNLDERTCSDANGDGDIGPFVDEALAFTLGPAAQTTTTILPETLYTPLEGAAPGPGGTHVLNEILFREACLGVVTNGSPALLGAPPIPVRDRFDYLESNLFHDSPSSAYQTIDMAQEANLSGDAVYETLLFNENNDIDLDGVVDSLDNCPFVANADQLDSGGFNGAPGPDGRGDACECGDANGTGSVEADELPVSDLQLLREYLVGMHPSSEELAAICSVSGDTTCDSADLVVLERALRLPGVGIEARCEAAVD